MKGENEMSIEIKTKYLGGGTGIDYTKTAVCVGKQIRGKCALQAGNCSRGRKLRRWQSFRD